MWHFFVGHLNPPPFFPFSLKKKKKRNFNGVYFILFHIYELRTFSIYQDRKQGHKSKENKTLMRDGGNFGKFKTPAQLSIIPESYAD